MFYLPEYPIYQVQLGELPPGFYAPQSAATMILTPGSYIDAAAPGEAARLVRRSLGPDGAAARGAARDPAPVRPLPLRAAARPGRASTRATPSFAPRTTRSTRWCRSGRARRRRVRGAALAAALAVFLDRRAAHRRARRRALLGFPLDDSWIHFQFARNLAEGARLRLQPRRARRRARRRRSGRCCWPASSRSAGIAPGLGQGGSASPRRSAPRWLTRRLVLACGRETRRSRSPAA